jgi:hypothetical protein
MSFFHLRVIFELGVNSKIRKYNVKSNNTFFMLVENIKSNTELKLDKHLISIKKINLNQRLTSVTIEWE